MKCQKPTVIFAWIIIVLIGAIVLLNTLLPKEKIQKQTRFLMDTYCTIQVPGNTDVIKAIEKAFDRMEEIDKKFNVLDTTSSLYRFNQKNTPIIDKEIINLLETALRIGRESQGAFDITIYPLIKLWGFFDDTPALPEIETIRQCMKNVGYNNLILKNEKVTKLKENIKMDLGGIAKGYAVNEAAIILKSEEIESGLIDAGGDIYAFGKIRSKPWRIGIRNPRGDGIIGGLEVSDFAVVTSGDYERYFEKDGVRYHHILDPKTGYPSRGLASVTVISPDPVLADAWSTALFVLGKEKGLKLIEKTPDIETFMITTDGEMIFSSGLKESLDIIN